jgi:hypothetical protein
LSKKKKLAEPQPVRPPSTRQIPNQSQAATSIHNDNSTSDDEDIESDIQNVNNLITNHYNNEKNISEINKALKDSLIKTSKQIKHTHLFLNFNISYCLTASNDLYHDYYFSSFAFNNQTTP